MHRWRPLHDRGQPRQACSARGAAGRRRVAHVSIPAGAARPWPLRLSL